MIEKSVDPALGSFAASIGFGPHIQLIHLQGTISNMRAIIHSLCTMLINTYFYYI